MPRSFPSPHAAPSRPRLISPPPPPPCSRDEPKAEPLPPPVQLGEVTYRGDPVQVHLRLVLDRVSGLDESAEGRAVLIRGATQAIRPISKKMGFAVLQQSTSTVQCVLVGSTNASDSTRMVRFAASLSKESIVDVESIVSLPKEPLKATT